MIILKEFWNRLLTSWATWTGALVIMAETVYALGLGLGWWTLPQETFAQVMTAVGVILGALYSLFTIGNNPTNKKGY